MWKALYTPPLLTKALGLGRGTYISQQPQGLCLLCYHSLHVDYVIFHANQLPLPRLQSAAGHVSDSCKWRYSKCLDLYLFTFTTKKVLIIQLAYLSRSISGKLQKCNTHAKFLITADMHLYVCPSSVLR